ncbi:hypothetical protein BD560DRAFT_443668 [Blakeslea trispora]|nr:hypothetical protein BD560DRAFT_443668 [Blakeslea trispora]
MTMKISEENIEDKEAAVQDNTNSSFEEHDCINLCNSDDDIPSSEHAIDQLKTDFVKPVVVEEPVFIHTARLNSNESNSCYIDAPFEMLFRCVLPYVKQLFSSLYDECNAFDRVLFEAFHKYVDCDVVAGSQLVREFVWKESTEFVKGGWNCVYSCFHWYLSNTSSRLRSLFCVYPHYEFNMCLEQKEQLRKKQVIPDALPFIKGNYPTMKQYFAARQIKDQEAKKKKMGELKIQFEEVYRRELLYKTRESSGCNSCGKQCAFKSGLILQEALPEFLLIMDPTNLDPKFINEFSELKEEDLDGDKSDYGSDHESDSSEDDRESLSFESDEN